MDKFRLSGIPIAVGSLWSFGFRTLTVLSGLLVTMIVTRQLAQEDAGRYFVLLSLVSIASVAFGWGLSTAVVRLIAQAQAEQRPEQTRGIIEMALKILAAGILLMGLLLTMPGVRAALASVLDLDHPASLRLLWLWTSLVALQSLLAEVFRGLQNILLASLFGGASTAVLSLLALGMLQLFGATSLNGIMAAIALATFGSILLAGAYLRRSTAELGPNSSRGWSELFNTTAPLWITQLSLVVLLQVDIWILQSAGDAASVALYGTATRMTLLLSLPLAALNAALMPIISARYALAEYAALQALLRGSAALAALPALAAVLLFAIIGEAILGTLFGDDYRAALPLLLVLSMGQLVNVLCGSAGYTLMMTGRQRDMMWITVAAGLFVILLGPTATSSHGALGLACISAGGLALQSLAMWLRVRQTRGLWTHPSLCGLLQPLATLRKLR